MPTRWETFPLELTGGLVSNQSRLQHGLKMPGSARVLQNFEPSIKGGYRRINGFTKFSDVIVPPYGGSVVQGTGQTGSSLTITNVHEAPEEGDTFTIAGVTGTYTVAAAGVTYSAVNKEAALALTTPLDSSPANLAAVTFTSGGSLIEGVFYETSASKVYALRGGALWRSSGTTWTQVNIPSFGSILVDGAGQTGTLLTVDNFDAAIDLTALNVVGTVFSIAGVDKVYTITATPTLVGTSLEVPIYPALASSPADNAAVTLLSTDLSGGSKARFETFNFDGTFKNVMVDGFNNPVVFTDTTFTELTGSLDVEGASFVAEYKDHLFFAKDDLVTFTAPFDETDFTPASGAGSYRIHPSNCTGLIVFRDTLINFSEEDIRKLDGDSVADFTLNTITNDLGCVRGDTIQEIGGDILFLGSDGVRFLGATERIGDFSLQLASRTIQDIFTNFINPARQFCSLKIREKNQYRIFGFIEGRQPTASLSYIGTQFDDQNGTSINWSETKGIQAYRAFSAYSNDTESAVFTNSTGYVYLLDVGNDFDGVPIVSYYYTPFMSVTDPNIRKTLYKISTFYDPEGSVTGRVSPKYDFETPQKVQPPSLVFDGGQANAVGIYGSAIYGSSVYGKIPDTVAENQAVGSFFTVSLQYQFEGGAPFILDTILLEYSIEDRK
jgi:hypothetical protein